MKINIDLDTLGKFFTTLTGGGILGGLAKYFFDFRNSLKQSDSKTRKDQLDVDMSQASLSRFEMETTQELKIKSAAARKEELEVEDQQLGLYEKLKKMYEDAISQSMLAIKKAEEAGRRAESAISDHERCEIQLKRMGERIDELERVNLAKVEASISPAAKQ